MKLSRSSVALMVMAACTALLVAHALQLHYDFYSLSSRYAELRRDYDALSSNYSRLRGDYEALSSRFSDLQASYQRLSYQYSLLQEDYSELKDRYSSLKRDHELLLDLHAKLKDKYSRLESNYNALSSECDSLKSRCATLEEKCRQLAGLCARLNETLTYVISVSNSYALAKEALPRVLNSDAVKATAPAVLSAGVSRSDFWGSMQRVYDYVVSNVDYAYDVEVPLWCVSELVAIDGQAYVYSVRYYNVWNYVQAPELTLRIRQGDCEDQAILVYAMAKYYMREVYGVDYALYLMCVEFYSGSAHMAVLMPVQGGRVCIIDPAGRYLTSQYGRITSRPALEELQRYSNYWAGQGGVKYVELWDVKLDGSFFVVAKGTVEEVAQALS